MMSGNWTLHSRTPSQNIKINTYILNVIEVFSRYAWRLQLKDKTATSITTALNSLYLDRKPIALQLDKGTEFVNSAVQRYLQQQRVNFQVTHNPDIKGSIIERFNRRLKTKMYKYDHKN